MDEPLASIFLGIIALAALLQAAFVGGLAYGARLGGKKLLELEKSFDAKVLPLGSRVTAAAEQVQEAAARVHEAAARTDALVGDATARVEHALTLARGKLVDYGERMDRAAEAMREEEIEPLKARLGQATALARGVRRALEVWRGGGPVDVEVDVDVDREV
jgi:hypothetical protein